MGHAFTIPCEEGRENRQNRDILLWVIDIFESSIEDDVLKGALR